MITSRRRSWADIAAGNHAPQRNSRKVKNGTGRQLELPIASVPKLRYAVPDSIALDAWKRLKERRETKDLL